MVRDIDRTVPVREGKRSWYCASRSRETNSQLGNVFSIAVAGCQDLFITDVSAFDRAINNTRKVSHLIVNELIFVKLRAPLGTPSK
ncbi:MAG TPA: hypothetical protein VNZ53_27960 [Steroidobacteraceae bacterium]|jgi:hypothetical protein|nr:hypothetical protein [Steroidobacteraceae bacterium]